MTKKYICVLGVGEVGKAIVKVFSKKYKVLKKDIKYDDVKSLQVEVLHVCIPYNKNFKTVVVEQAKLNKPKLIIIHSTIAPGTSNEIAKKTGVPTVHSPIMGLHPDLAKHIKKFKKIVGPTSNKSATLAIKHLKYAGLKTIVFSSAFESELGKLLDTTYYGWNIIFSKLVYSLCKQNKIDFKNAYTLFNQIYNEGYGDIKSNVVRPILDYKEGEIGGHCVIPNLQILESFQKTEFGQFILKENNRLKN